MYNGSVIWSDPVKINRGKKKKIYISIIIDEMKGRTSRPPTQGQRWGRLSKI
jgi:hypothetical protein